MDRLNKIRFTCLACETKVDISGDRHSARIDRLHEQQGRCEKCGGDRWQIELIYSYREVTSGDKFLGGAFGAGMGLLSGGVVGAAAGSVAGSGLSGRTKLKTIVASDVNHLMVTAITKPDQERIDKIVGLVKEIHNQKALEIEQRFKKSDVPRTDDEIVPERMKIVPVNSVTVVCENGHENHFNRSFIGMMRPCTVCQAKVKVSE